jgi:hypothetical protein
VRGRFSRFYCDFTVLSGHGQKVSHGPRKDTTIEFLRLLGLSRETAIGAEPRGNSREQESENNIPPPWLASWNCDQ